MVTAFFFFPPSVFGEENSALKLLLTSEPAGVFSSSLAASSQRRVTLKPSSPRGTDMKFETDLDGQFGSYPASLYSIVLLQE